MDKIICPNCGADIAVSEPKCPFCGYINIPGAEEKFMQDLERTQEELQQIPKMQEEEIKKSFFKSSKVVWITILIVVLVLLFFVGGSFACSKILDSIFLVEYDAKEELIWEKENYPILDEMYEKGDYDGIVAFQNEVYEANWQEKTNHSLYNWEHYDFINYYVYIEEVRDIIKNLDEGTGLDKYRARSLVYNCMSFHYRTYENEYIRLSDEELQLLETYREYAEEVFYTRLKFTDEEADGLYKDAWEYSVLGVDECYDYADKIRDRIE